jgi:Na+-driven multidrug efflux pump
MKIGPARLPVGLLIAIVLCLIAGLVAGPLIENRYTAEDLADNVLLNAIPFILIFVSILLVFISLIVMIGSVLNGNIPERIYRPIELLTMAGIGLGVFFIFQPWSFFLYRNGFMVLLIATLSFILWSHIVPRGKHAVEEVSSFSVSEFERSEAGD